MILFNFLRTIQKLIQMVNIKTIRSFMKGNGIDFLKFIIRRTNISGGCFK